MNPATARTTAEREQRREPQKVRCWLPRDPGTQRPDWVLCFPSDKKMAAPSPSRTVMCILWDVDNAPDAARQVSPLCDMTRGALELYGFGRREYRHDISPELYRKPWFRGLIRSALEVKDAADIAMVVRAVVLRKRANIPLFVIMSGDYFVYELEMVLTRYGAEVLVVNPKFDHAMERIVGWSALDLRRFRAEYDLVADAVRVFRNREVAERTRYVDNIVSANPVLRGFPVEEVLRIMTLLDSRARSDVRVARKNFSDDNAWRIEPNAWRKDHTDLFSLIWSGASAYLSEKDQRLRSFLATLRFDPQSLGASDITDEERFDLLRSVYDVAENNELARNYRSGLARQRAGFLNVERTLASASIPPPWGVAQQSEIP